MADGASISRRAGDPPAAGSPARSDRLLAGRLAAPLVVALFALAAWLGLRPLSAVPEVVPAAAPATVFSAERALVDLQALTAARRPVGSAANAAARDTLLAQIAALGLAPQVQSTHVYRREPGFPEAHLMAVENILVRLPGSEPGGKALLVSGHYDSVATAVGASDCAMCSAVTLETLRAVAAAAAAGQPPRHDIIFLFTDAEEIGVAGALGFMRDHPWAADVGLSLVFEGLGSDGAPLLYIAGPDSGAIVGVALDALAGDARYPLASSFLHDFMWTVAGNTGSDLDAFVEGAPGLGFIYLSLETAAAYHTDGDSLANLDLRSVQGMGDFALALTRHFGDRPLDELPAAPNLVLFPLWPGMTARYTPAAALPLALAAIVLLVAALVVGLRRGRLTGRGLLASFAAWIPAFITAVVLVSTAWWLARLLTPQLHNFTAGGWYGAGFYLVAALALALAVAVLWWDLLRRFAAADLLGGGLLWWAFLAFLTALALPGLSYLFVWPVLVYAGARLLVEALAAAGRFTALPGLAAGFAAAWLFAPVAVWLWIYAGRAEAMMGLPMAALPVVFLWPALTLLVAAMGNTRYEIRDTSGRQDSAAGRMPAVVSGLLLLLGLLLFVLPALRRPAPDRPWANAVVYTLDANRGEAYWLAFNDSRAGRGTRHVVDEWTTQFLAGTVEETTFDPWLLTRSDTLYPALRSAAPVIDLPRTAIVAAPGKPGVARWRLARPAEAWLTRVVARSTAPITAVTFDGEALDLAGTQPAEYTFLIVGRAADVALDIATTGEVSLDVLDRLVIDVGELAARAGQPVVPRPAWMVTAAASDTADGAIVVARYE